MERGLKTNLAANENESKKTLIHPKDFSLFFRFSLRLCTFAPCLEAPTAGCVNAFDLDFYGS
jgi:hypothetical protein